MGPGKKKNEVFLHISLGLSAKSSNSMMCERWKSHEGTHITASVMAVKHL